MKPAYTPGDWSMDPYTGMIRSAKANRRIGFFQGIEYTPAQRKEHVVNCRLLEMAPQLYEAVVELYTSHSTSDTDRLFNAVAQAERLIHRVCAPIVIPTRTRPTGVRP